LVESCSISKASSDRGHSLRVFGYLLRRAVMIGYSLSWTFGYCYIYYCIYYY